MSECGVCKEIKTDCYEALMIEGAQNGTTAAAWEFRKINIKYIPKTIQEITHWNGSANVARIGIRDSFKRNVYSMWQDDRQRKLKVSIGHMEKLLILKKNYRVFGIIRCSIKNWMPAVLFSYIRCIKWSKTEII